MTLKKMLLLIVVYALPGLITSCQKTKVEQNTPGKETNLVTKLKVNATREDLCRLVLKQEVFQDTAISNDTKSVIITMLSDGSDVRRIIEVDSLTAGYTDIESPNGFQLSVNLDKLIYTIGYIGRIGKGKLYENVMIYNLRTKQRDSLFYSNIVYEKNGYSFFVNETKYDPTNRMLTISTNTCFKRYNMEQHSFVDFSVAGQSFINVGPNKIIYNRSHNDTIQCEIYDVREKKSILIRNDTLNLEIATVTDDGKIILLQKEIENDSLGKIGDSLYFYDSTLSIKNVSYLQNRESYHYTIGLSGNWIYFVDTVAVRRIRTEEIKNHQNTVYNDLVTKSQLIYELPCIIRDTDVKTVCQGTIVQILPIKSEDK
jgi:hypothetical protein